MANLKRNMMELVTNPEEASKGDEPQFKKYWTPAFVSYQKTREALELAAKMESGATDSTKISELLDEMENFVIELYENKFSPEELRDGLHGPDALTILGNQVRFISDGEQSSDTKKFLREKNS